LSYGESHAPTQEDPESTSFWRTLAGQPVDKRLYAGMWTYHTHASSREKDNATNYGLSYVRNGYFASTFKNSYYNWSFAAGLQRDIYDKHFASDTQQFKVGYRAALMTGYDDRLCSHCGDSPVLPVIVPYINWQYKNMGLESQYAVILATIGFYYHFN
tara:strand:- start:691 stop:1164 length:474 start_codon:yes stop_codon:yes gene_type:complete